MEAVSVSIDDQNETVIDGVVINEKIFDEDLYEYRVEVRDESVDNLIGWIAEDNKDKALMKHDLKYLMSCDDEYMFSSISTNEYVLFSDDEESFNKIAKEILELHNKMD